MKEHMLTPRLGLTLLTSASALAALLVQAPAAHADFGPGWRYECYPGEGSKPLPHQGIAQKNWWRSQPAICSGDQQAVSFSSTRTLSSGFRASLAGFGRRAR
ncbi:hypothetical protein [Nocardia tengchongensis]|uniref:hypothetical protein n=1 Tax=Nocardia tengchongensis TaxID=2055889 RepID=UPI003653300D